MKSWWRSSLRFGMLACLSLAACGADHGSAQSQHAALPKVSVSGSALVAGVTRAPIALRGFVFTAGVWFDVPPGGPNGDLANLGFMESERDFVQLESLGANLAILYLNYRWFSDPAGYALVDRVLGWCAAHDVYLLPSLVVYPGGGQRGGSAFFASADLEDQARKFWVEFAARYRGRSEIAGYDLLNEPQGAPIDEIVALQTSLVDAVRAVDPDSVLFIEPMWGDPYSLRALDRPGIAYDAHYYLPLYLTSQQFPWLYGGAIPANVHYPNLDGTMVNDVPVVASVDDTSVPAGSYDWQTVSADYAVPANSELAYVKVFSNGDAGATLYFDDLEVTLDDGAFSPIPNGSFETKADVFADAQYWQASTQGAGAVQRSDEAAAAGQWSAKIANSAGLSSYATHPGLDGNGRSIFFLGTESGIKLNGASKLRLRFQVKAAGATAGKNGVQLNFCRVQRGNFTVGDLNAQLDSLLLAKSNAFDAPLLIGEFATSLVGVRPDSLDYVSDVLKYANQHGLSFAYYHYREVKDQVRYLGLYEGPFGAPTDYTSVDADVLARVQAALRP